MPERSRLRTVDAWLACLTVAALLSLISWDLVPGAATVVLFFIWTGLRTAPPGEARDPPVLQLALSFQFLQVTCGVLYLHLVGRRLVEMDRVDCEPMVALGLGCVASLAAGLAAALSIARPRATPHDEAPVASTRTLFVVYLVATAANGTAQAAAFSIPAITQALVALTFVRLALLFIVVRRLLRPHVRPAPLLFLVAFELVVGFTGFFADFREALMIALLAMLDGIDRARRRAAHLAMVSLLVVITLLAGIMWTGIKEPYRKAYRADAAFGESATTRLERVEALASDWLSSLPEHLGPDADKFVSRVWAVYYPALAVRRVPEVLPFEHGALLGKALLHIVTPRFLYPDKKSLDSDSEMVRKYSGIWVASQKEGTSIAFGYATESYIDFGVPGMFVPVFLFGLIMGLCYRGLLRAIARREIAVPTTCAIFWISLSLFERSWIKTIGESVTLLVVLGGGAILLDRLLARRTGAARAEREGAGRATVASRPW